MKPQALAVQKSTHGTPISAAASTLKLITLSATTHVTGGTPAVPFSSPSSLLKGPWQVVMVE
jgi:hypothetical protein